MSANLYHPHMVTMANWASKARQAGLGTCNCGGGSVCAAHSGLCVSTAREEQGGGI